MKKLFYMLSVFLLFVSCSKDDPDKPLVYENLYTLQDDPSDPVKHRIYEIYENYGVPVYFNDTVGKYYVREDVNGNPYYRYELLDINWNFFSDNSQTVKYKYYYQTEPFSQMISLDFVENLLENISRPLQPAAFFLADSISFTDNNGIGFVVYLTGFRLLTVTSLHTKTEAAKDSLVDKITRGLIKQKIANYKSDMSLFNTVSETEWYDSKWKDDLGCTLGTWGPAIFEDWAKDYSMRVYGWTEERVEEECDKVRTLIGAFGFVGGSKSASSIYSPDNTAQDLDTYMTEMLSCDRAEFIRRWEKCPLVMKKYEILYNLLKDKLDYEL